MPKYLVERDIPNIGQKSNEEIQNLCQKAVDAVESVGNNIHWVETFVCDNKTFGVYYAPNTDLLQQHAKKFGLPIKQIHEVRLVVDPTFAETGTRTQFQPTGTSTGSRGQTR